MKNTILTLILALLFIGCNNSATNEPPTPPTKIVGSYIQKGPFSLDTDVLAQVLDKDFKVLRDLPQARIIDYLGKYELNLTSIDTSAEDKYIEVSIDGFFFNEVTGKLSDGKLKLRGFGLAKNQNLNINVNVLSHITSDRIKEIIKTGKSFEEASLQAKNEILTIFSIPESQWTEYGDFNSANIFGSTKSDAFLLAVSAIFIGDSSKTTAEIAELLNDFSLDFKDNGIIDNSTLVMDKILNGKAKYNHDINSIISNLKSYADSKGLSFKNSDIAQFFNISNIAAPIFTSLVSNGDFGLYKNGWSTEINNGATGDITVVNNELVVRTENSGLSKDSISIITTSDIKLQNGKTYSIMINATSSDPTNKVRFAVEGVDGSNINSFSDGWSETYIDGSKINKVFTYTANESTPYLSLQLGGDLTKSGTTTKILSCHIAEIEKVDTGNPTEWVDWIDIAMGAQATFTKNDIDTWKWTFTVSDPGPDPEKDYYLQMRSKSITNISNGDVYQLFFTGKTESGSHKLSAVLQSNAADYSLYVDHISNHQTFFTLTSSDKTYSTIPFKIENLQSVGPELKFQFGGTNLSAAGAIYQFSDISLYKFK